MKNYILIFLFCFTGLAGFAQENIMLKGKIKSESLEGSSINILNLNKLVGTTNNPNGEFEILVSVRDSIVFSSIQFENLTLKITPEIMEKKYLEVYLKNRIDQLPEVKISNIKLTGDLKKDLEQTPFYAVPAYSYSSITLARFESDLNDHQVAPNNLALGQRSEPMVSLDLFALATKVFKIKQVEVKPLDPLLPPQEIVEKVREIFGDVFFTQTLQVKEMWIDDFLYACADNGLSKEYRDMGNEMDLINFLIDQSKIYHAANPSN